MRVLITGGTGTLGHAFALFARASLDAEITVFSRSELLQAKMRQAFPELSFVIGDVTNEEDVNRCLQFGAFDTVIHAAAMKRIPECEGFPQHAIRVNALGTENVLRASAASGVEVFVGLSTDKACEAITAYGATKKLVEDLTRSYTNRIKHPISVRYGNVVASRGSVIELWRRQSREGKKLSITDPTMTRFWMSPFEAVSAILEAIECTKPGDVFIPRLPSLEMGDLASMLFPGVPHLPIGLRSVEKVHEVLVAESEPILDLGGYFLLRAGRPSAGIEYSSKSAHRLGSDQILRLLRDADRVAEAQYAAS